MGIRTPIAAVKIKHSTNHYTHPIPHLSYEKQFLPVSVREWVKRIILSDLRLFTTLLSGSFSSAMNFRRGDFLSAMNFRRGDFLSAMNFRRGAFLSTMNFRRRAFLSAGFFVRGAFLSAGLFCPRGFFVRGPVGRER